jgi:hypothetical protein
MMPGQIMPGQIMNEKMTQVSLKTEVDRGDALLPPRGDGNLPLLGLFAVGFGALSIFTLAPVFGPLGLVLGVIALFVGQIGLGLGAIFLSAIGIMTSPALMTLIGFGAVLAWLGL